MVFSRVFWAMAVSATDADEYGAGIGVDLRMGNALDKRDYRFVNGL